MIPKAVSHQTTAKSVLRVQEQKRAVEQVVDHGSAVARLNVGKKYAAIFDAMIAQHQADLAAAQPQPPTFPIEV